MDGCAGVVPIARQSPSIRRSRRQGRSGPKVLLLLVAVAASCLRSPSSASWVAPSTVRVQRPVALERRVDRPTIATKSGVRALEVAVRAVPPSAANDIQEMLGGMMMAGGNHAQEAMAAVPEVAQQAMAAAPEATQELVKASADAGDATSYLWAFLALAGVAAAVVTAGDGAGDGVVDKTEVKDYFNSVGFSRWSRIYSETENVNFVQQDIRDGHAETVNKILRWLDGSQIKGKTVCDAGCGLGSLSIPLAERGAQVSASDISSAMADEAERRAKEVLPADAPMPQFGTSDLEALEGSYDCVCCVDVLIHYPPARLQQMVTHLAGLSKDRVILSFAPKTWYYQLLKRFGEFFPGPAKTTRAYLHDEAIVEKALEQAGFRVTRRDLTATNFYFSRLLEARRVAATA